MEKSLYLKLRNKHDLKPKHFKLLSDLSINAALFSAAFIPQTIFPQFILLKIISIPLLSILMFRSFSLMHDGTHNALSINSKVNTLVGIITGTFCFLPFSQWKEIHQQHHFWSGNIDHDPSMSLIKVLPRLKPQTIRWLDWCWQHWIPIMALLQHVVFWSHSLKILVTHKNKFESYLSILFPILFWIPIINLASENYLLFCFLPATMIYLIGVEIINFPHHLQKIHLKNKDRLKVWEQHLGSRSCIYPRWISQYIVLNFNYHIEHHLYPEAPWYCLDQIHLAIIKDLHQGYEKDENLNWNLRNRNRSILELIQSQHYVPDHNNYAV